MTLRLPRFEQGTPLVDKDGLPTVTFHRWWQAVADAIETSFNDLADTVAAIAAAQDAADAAQASADAAAADAATAQAQADQAALDNKIATSYVIPAEVMTAADVGTDCTITILGHDRRYGDSSTLTVSGGTITGLAFATDYAVYYDDITCLDTTPTYQYTTVPSNALNNYVSGRHYVGLITTPADGAADSTGGSNPPGGGGSTFWNRFDT